MTNRIAIALVLVIILAFVADAIWFGGELPVMLGRQVFALVEYLAFWR